MTPQTREQAGWTTTFDEWDGLTSTILAKKLRAEDILQEECDGAIGIKGSFLANMVEALKFKKADKKRPRGSEMQLYHIKLERTINRTQFLAWASKSKTI